MSKKSEEHVYFENEVFNVFDNQKVEEITISIEDLSATLENYGEWKELIGYLKGKNLNPKLVKKYIEAILDIEKLVDK